MHYQEEKGVFARYGKNLKNDLLMKLLHLSIANEAQPKILLFIFTSVF